MSDYQVALQQFQREQQKFDIVFLDPPYSLHLITPVLQKITPLLKNHSLLVCEWETEKIEVDAHYRLWKEKKYGEKHISIYEYLV